MTDRWCVIPVPPWKYKIVTGRSKECYFNYSFLPVLSHECEQINMRCIQPIRQQNKHSKGTEGCHPNAKFHHPIGVPPDPSTHNLCRIKIDQRNTASSRHQQNVETTVRSRPHTIESWQCFPRFVDGNVVHCCRRRRPLGFCIYLLFRQCPGLSRTMWDI